MNENNAEQDNDIQLEIVNGKPDCHGNEEEGNQNRTGSEVSIGWRNLRFETQGWFGRRKKVILNRLNGCFEYHTLNGFMGPSGAGKTTLLNCLSGNRVQGLTEDSEIYLNKDKQCDEKLVSYFIEQHVENTIVGKMRVGQILRYAYRFKNGNEGDMEGHIRSTIEELLLDDKVLDRKFEQCSGGEQKRIAIAQELMSLRKPTLLFVDEPTTGLDSNAAHLLMQCLKQLATNHRMTVVTSIHVPSDDILNLFDKLYVLAKGGVCIYSGRPQQLRSYLETKIEDLVIPKEQPPIEVLTKIASTGINDPCIITLSSLTLPVEYHQITKNLSKLSTYPNGVPNHRKQFSFRDLWLQISRMFQVVLVADISNIILQMIIGIVYILLMSSFFGMEMALSSGCYPLSFDQAKADAEIETGFSFVISNRSCTSQIRDDSMIRKNVFYLGSLCLFAVFMVNSIGPMFSITFIRMFANEHRNQWYSLGTFFGAVTLVSLLQTWLYIVPFPALGYFLTGQHLADNDHISWQRLGNFLFYFQMLAIYILCIGQLIASILWKHFDLSIVVSVFISVIFVPYSGYMIDLESSTNSMILFVKDILQFDKIIKAIVYTIYGLDRCNLDWEYSQPLVSYHVEEWNFSYLAMVGILFNSAVIRLLTLAYMNWQFNQAGRRSKHRTELNNVVEMLTIDYETRNYETKQNDNNNNNNQILLITKRVKSEKEIKFENFSRNKIIVAWQNLSLYGNSFLFERIDSSEARDTSSDTNAILKNLNGEFRFGTLNALMGTSGAGKTSLLKVLNGRDKTRLSGSSQFYLSKFTRIQTCFITQDVSGHLLPGLTAKQTLVYASRLKNGQLRECGVDTSQIDHQQIALNLLDELELSDTADTLVEKCSGGERKRLALALELTALQMPNLICIDEPTSGLDSNSAEVVVACLRKLAQAHSITIVASIHQPNTELLLMFDQIYVLARGGVCIYSGPPTTIDVQLNSISKNFIYESKFPIETLIKLSSCSFSDSSVHQLTFNNDLNFTEQIINSGLLANETQPVIDGIQQNRRRFSLEDSWILCVRYLVYIRGHLWIDWIVLLILIAIYANFSSNIFDPIVGTVAGCLNLQEDDFNSTCAKTEQRLNEETLLLYNMQYTVQAFSLFFVFIIIQSPLLFLRESIYFFNEHHNGWYSSGSFYLSKCLLETFPIILLLSVYVYSLNIYESTIPGIYFHLLLIMSLTTVAYHGLTHFVCLLVDKQMLLTIIAVVSFFMLNILLTNFTVPLAQVHYLYRMMSVGSITGHLFDSLIVLQYGFGRCPHKQIQPVLYLFSLDDSNYYRSVLALAFIALIYHTMSLVLLVRRANPAQNRRYKIQNIIDQVSRFEPTNTIVPGLGSPNDFHIKFRRF